MGRLTSFTARNFKEIIRDPLSLVFNFAFPLVMLLIFSCFTFGKDETYITSYIPMFASKAIIPAVTVFGFSFLTLFSSMLVAKDRATSFTYRLKGSPMTSVEMYLGYALPNLLIAAIQFILVYLCGYLLSFGTAIHFDLFSVGTLVTFFIDMPIAILFISCGLLFGMLFNDKANSGISSILVNVSAIGSGMFMPIASMGGFKIVCQTIPFYHAVTLAKDGAIMNFPSKVDDFKELIDSAEASGMSVIYNIADTWWMNLIVILLYTILSVIASIFVFYKKMNSDN